MFLRNGNFKVEKGAHYLQIILLCVKDDVEKFLSKVKNLVFCYPAGCNLNNSIAVDLSTLSS